PLPPTPRSTPFPYTTLFRSRDKLDSRAGAARHLAALPRLELDVVDERAGRDVLQRKRVAGLDVRGRAGLDRRADLQSRGREDVRDRKSTRLNSSHQIISYAV